MKFTSLFVLFFVGCSSINETSSEDVDSLIEDVTCTSGRTVDNYSFRFCGSFVDGCGVTQHRECDPNKAETTCGASGWNEHGHAYGSLANRCGGGCVHSTVKGNCGQWQEWTCANSIDVNINPPPIEAICFPEAFQGPTNKFCCNL